MPAHSFVWRQRAPDCRHYLTLVDPYVLLGLLRFFPIERVRAKGRDRAEVVYAERVGGFLGGKAKVSVDIERGATETRIRGKGPLEFEIRIACPGSDALLVSMNVSGRLSDKLSREKAEEVFETIKRYVAEMMEIPVVAEPPRTPAQRGAEAAPAPAASPRPAPAAAAPPAPAAAPAPPAGGETPRGEMFDKAMCLVRLVTAGFPVDEELSRRVPSEYSPRLATGRIVESGVRLAEALDLLRYEDADYLIRLGFDGARADVVRLGTRGVVGVYYRGPRGEELYGTEAAMRIAEEACVPGKRIAYWVVRL